ncbi:unnamed protein product [Penicillium salamii]|uniref:Uncharacterized protein n=1 Tax=Penicillium salamii TaxID=1612424 RepID=A0A9W4JJI8_9EURO|nr:unnamed protein product [Penicillium salamii]CAG8141262.1 unnamed protein product [Penicillium salamii]CAG8155027.1 unnamed protein product [Penicillium salamii]CAG8158158.1 unnamed protein product [Penicillium salamii]CAG8160333.1 unnamed protein product [Penicillium salamii]
MTLQEEITTLTTLPLPEAIQKISNLAPELTSTFLPKYGYWVTHPAHEGPGDLNDLGRIWLNLGYRCHSEHAPLQTRLIHQSMDDVFFEIYGATYDILKKGLAEGTIPKPVFDDSLGCACCRGEPDATILAGFHENKALYFDVEEYRALWGDHPNRGERIGADSHAVAASREQVEEAIARETGIVSML